jgi:hypothetical protein
VLYLSSNMTDAKEELNDLLNDKILNGSMAIVAFEFVTFNAHFDMYVLS